MSLTLGSPYFSEIWENIYKFILAKKEFTFVPDNFHIFVKTHLFKTYLKIQSLKTPVWKCVSLLFKGDMALHLRELLFG